jgi:sulfur-oxidizing protein SoxA
MLALAAFVGNQSRGLPLRVSIEGSAQSWSSADVACTRRGSADGPACTHRHDQHWGRRLLAEPISQGHRRCLPDSIGWNEPGMGTLHRRFRSCLSGVRAEMLPQGADDYLALELYLAWRAAGWRSTPGVRR